MLAIEPMGNTVQFVFYAIALAAFVLAAIALKIGDGKTNLLGVGLAAFTVPIFWEKLAGI